jgi:hypothetical protein
MRNLPITLRLLLVVLLLGAAVPAAASAASPFRSYADTQSIPLDPAAARSVLVARTPPENAPNQSDIDDCMGRPGADTEHGHVRSRYLWCLRNIARIVQPNGSQARIHYQIVGYGRDDGERNVRLFFRVSKVEAVGSTPPPPSTPWTISVECEAGDPDCGAGGSVTQTLIEWDTGQDWWRFTVGSAETGPAEGDNVAFHRFRFRGGTPGYPDRVLPF